MKLSIVAVLALFPLSASLAQQGPDAARLEGVYREVHASGDSSGAKYNTTDVLRILRHDANTIYFDIDLNFYNGHSCGIAGFAVQDKKDFVFRGNAGSQLKACELRINISGKKISFDDLDNNCRITCGARGGYATAEFNLSKRRPFPAASKVRQSEEYKSDLEAFRKGREGGK